jgi:hypothetical protein
MSVYDKFSYQEAQASLTVDDEVIQTLLSDTSIQSRAMLWV